MSEDNTQLAELSQRRVALEKKKKQLEGELKTVSKEIDALHKPILMAMAQANLKNITRPDGTQLIKRRDIECSKKAGVPTEAVCRILKEENLDWLVAETYSAGKFKNWLREQENEQGIDVDIGPKKYLPERLKDLFTVIELNKVIVRGA